MMNNQLLKRRVIGAAVLVALAVIFIPMILSGGRDEMPLFGSNIPKKPRAIEKLKSLEIPTPPKVEQPNENIRIPVAEQLPPARAELKKPAQGQADASGKAVTSSKAVQSDKQAATSDKASATKAWVVQVGSFGNRANALALQKKLRRHKFAAFVEFVKGKQGGVYRVRVGPEVDRAKAEETRQAINKQLKIRGVVMSHP